MRAAALSTLCLGLLVLAASVSAQPVPPPVAVKVAKSVAKEEPKKDEPFDQHKADVETVKSAGYTEDVKSLTDFFRNHTVTEADKARINGIIQKLSDDTFEVREAASDELSRSGVPAIALLRAAMNAKDADYEVARRCELALQVIEKVPTRSLASAAARLLAGHKDDGVTEVLLNYLPLGDDESVGEEIRNTLTALAVRDGKPDRNLEGALESKDALKRGAAAEAFARANDKASRERMKAFLKK
jgi:hypothetical protein